MKVAKRLVLKSSCRQKTNSVAVCSNMLIRLIVGIISITYANIESLYYIPEINIILCVNFTAV